MTSESTRFFGQPRLTKPIFISKVYRSLEANLSRAARTLEMSMMTDASSWIEPELRGGPPRPVRLTEAGGRRLLLSTVPLATLLAVVTQVFLSRQRPRWMEAAFALLFLVSVGAIYRVVALWRARVSLVEEGVATQAEVTAKERARGGGAHYYCWYETGGRRHALGWAGEWDDAEIGDAVTVLYSAEEPSQAVAYRWAGCEIAPQTDRPASLPTRLTPP